MTQFRHLDVSLDLCTKCGGVWLDGDEIQKVLGPAFADLRPTSTEWMAGAVKGIGAFVDDALDVILYGP